MDFDELCGERGDGLGHFVLCVATCERFEERKSGKLLP